jgi:hypothetical protein
MIVHGRGGALAFSLEGFGDDGVDLESIGRSRLQCLGCAAPVIMSVLYAASQLGGLERSLPGACCLRPDAGQGSAPLEKCLTCRLRDLDLEG